MQRDCVYDFIVKLGIEIPAKSEFVELGNATALYHENEKFWQLNFERGMLLYALVSKYKPLNILEFGTGGGYSTLIMAKALHDNKIDGKVFTIDSMSIHKKHIRPVCIGSESPRLEMTTVYDIWKKMAPSNWTEKIILLNGYAREIFDKYKFPKIDFAYIDGAHFYQGVKHDFYSLLTVSSKNFGVLFDDYGAREHYGVKRLLDELDAEFDITLIDTDLNRDLIKLNAINNEEYGMCWLNFYNSKQTIDISFFNEIPKFIKKYRKIEKRIKLRVFINDYFPFLKKIIRYFRTKTNKK